MVDAEVASVSAAGGRNEALVAISRTFGLHQFRRSEPEMPGPEGDRAVLWLSSEHCLIGVPEEAC